MLSLFQAAPRDVMIYLEKLRGGNVAKKEAITDFWVHSLLVEAGIKLEPQGSSIVEINDALRTASKKGSGKVGFPEFVGVVKDFLIVIENKSSVDKHLNRNKEGLISTDVKDVQQYAMNGALFYGQHLSKNTSYKKIIAFGVSGVERKHIISPIFIDESEYYRELPNVESFISFNKENINEYYTREILKEDTDLQKELSEILKDASELHEDLRNYGNLKDIDKPLIVSGILLALREEEFGSFEIENLTGDDVDSDGEKIYNAIEKNLRRSKVSPEVKRDKILSQFSIIKDTQILNEINKTLNKTPLKHFSEFLKNKIYRNIKYNRSSEDYLGRFYGEFMSYSGGDGQTLGIVLTPKHVTDLFCDLVDLDIDDIVLDPCAGTAGFLIAAMHYMLAKTDDKNTRKNIKQKQLHGFELQPYMFTIATTNMILRGDGKSNLINHNFLKENPHKLQLKQATVGMMNPPYSQGSKKNPDLYEIAFLEHLLDSLTEGGRAIVIIPQSSVTGKTKEEKSIKNNILKRHTLEGVITLNKDTFYGVGTMPCIAIFTAGEPHPEVKECKFIDFRNDGYKISPHIGLIETESAKDKKQHLLDVWFDRIESESVFCVKTTIENDDEWLHSFYYFNDSIPLDSDFEKTMTDYMTFEFSMLIQGKDYLFPIEEEIKTIKNLKLSDRKWMEFSLSEIARIEPGKRLTKSDMVPGKKPFIGATDSNNGITEYVENSNISEDSNVLGVNYNGSVLESFYHPYKAIFSDDVKRIHLKNHIGNKYVYLFLKTSIYKQKSKYQYSYKANEKRLKRQKILLPIDMNENPDYDFMEGFMFNIEENKKSKYIR